MSQIAKVFQKGPAFIGYLTAGDGGAAFTIEAVLALVEGGVDLIELGIPFSDPVADGPVIQKAMERALNAGTTPETVLEIVKGIRKRSDVPIVLFGYANPFLAMGESYLQRAVEAGCDGLLMVDVPVGKEIFPIPSTLDQICLLTPTTPKERIKEIAEKGRGFLYYVCQKGTTGVRKKMASDFEAKAKEIKSLTNLPVAAGFGIADRTTANEAIQHLDGFIVGSAFVKKIESGASPEELKQVAQAIDPRGNS